MQTQAFGCMCLYVEKMMTVEMKKMYVLMSDRKGSS